MPPNKLHELKKRFTNKRVAIIVGNGPSVLDINWDRIQNSERREDTLFLACNRISILFEKTNWRPDIYSCLTSVSLVENQWRESIDKCLENKDTTSIVFNAYKKNTKLENIHDNVIFAKNVIEHHRNQPIVKDFIDVPMEKGIIKSYSATATLFQICNYLDMKTIGVIGQDGYIFEVGKNHFDDAYGFEASNFSKTNKRILALHKELRRFFDRRAVEIYNLSNKSILKEIYPNKDIFDFMSCG